MNIKNLILSGLIGIIVWSRPDGGVSITTLVNGDSRQEAARLQSNGTIPLDWEAVAFDIEISMPRTRRNHWRWDKTDRGLKDDLPDPVTPSTPRNTERR